MLEYYKVYYPSSKNSGFFPKSSILIESSIINHPFWIIQEISNGRTFRTDPEQTLVF